MTSPFKAISIALALFLLNGCAELAKQVETIKPTAEVTGARIANINFDQADIIFDLAIDNKNPVAIDLAGLDYDFKVENQSLISGRSTQAVHLKAGTVSPVQLPVTLKFDDLKKLPGQIWQKETIAYDLATVVNVMLPVIGNYAIPLDKQGTLPVPRVPTLRLNDIKLKNLSFSAAEVVARVEVNNPNNFRLAVSNLDYQLNINQQQWGQGNIAQAYTIPENGKGVIDVPIKLDLKSMGMAMYSMLTSSDPLQYQLTGNATIDTGIDLLRNYRLPLNMSGKVAVQ